MAIQTRTSGNVTILDIKGRITTGVGDVELRNAVREALESGKTNLLINMSGVTMIDSSGMGELVSSYMTTNHRGGKLKLVNLSAKVTDLLHITQLITVFETYDSEQEAIDSYS
jgi:anti-anti-sigma factor